MLLQAMLYITLVRNIFNKARRLKKYKLKNSLSEYIIIA